MHPVSEAVYTLIGVDPLYDAQFASIMIAGFIDARGHLERATVQPGLKSCGGAFGLPGFGWTAGIQLSRIKPHHSHRTLTDAEGVAVNYAIISPALPTSCEIAGNSLGIRLQEGWRLMAARHGGNRRNGHQGYQENKGTGLKPSLSPRPLRSGAPRRQRCPLVRPVQRHGAKRLAKGDHIVTFADHWSSIDHSGCGIHNPRRCPVLPHPWKEEAELL